VTCTLGRTGVELDLTDEQPLSVKLQLYTDVASDAVMQRNHHSTGVLHRQITPVPQTTIIRRFGRYKLCIN